MEKVYPAISLEEAQLLMEFAIHTAKINNAPGAIAIVDNGGHLVYLSRLDNTMNAAANIAIGKAATAVAFQRDTKALEDVIQDEGRTTMLSLNSVTPQPYVPLKGGYLIKNNGQIIGGIAVAGTMDAHLDEIVAEQALESFYSAVNYTSDSEM